MAVIGSGWSPQVHVLEVWTQCGCVEHLRNGALGRGGVLTLEGINIALLVPWLALTRAGYCKVRIPVCLASLPMAISCPTSLTCCKAAKGSLTRGQTDGAT